jgi:chemotaxis protein histidine kinase CheA
MLGMTENDGGKRESVALEEGSPGVQLAKYLKKAFLYHWNLLALLGASGFALLSGHPDVALPLVMAVEAAYLGFLGTHPKFQKYVEAQEAKTTRKEGRESTELIVQRLLAALPDRQVKRFEALRARCLELRQIARELKDPHAPDEQPPLEELQLSGLDRLLWIFLRLLYSQQMLQKFFQSTSDDQIRKDIAGLEARLQRLAGGPDDPQRQKIRKTLEDNLATCRERLANFEKARGQSELVEVEIERLENKIRSLSELAINRQEPDFILAQVDQVADSMVQTERTMSELQFATGLDTAGEEVPQLLRRETVQMRS